MVMTVECSKLKVMNILDEFKIFSMENIPMAWEKISNLYFTTKNWNTTVKQFLEGKFDGIESLLIYPVLLMLYCVHLVTRPG